MLLGFKNRKCFCYSELLGLIFGFSSATGLCWLSLRKILQTALSGRKLFEKVVKRFLTVQFFFYSRFFLNDAPRTAQVTFQDPATSRMEGLISLHQSLSLFLLAVIALVV
jgi:hypothetical protein